MPRLFCCCDLILWAIGKLLQGFLILDLPRMIFALIVSGSALLVTLRFLYRFLFPKDEKDYEGYKERWYGKDLSSLPNDEARRYQEDTSVRPFKIQVSNDVLKDLKMRLERTRFEDPLEDSLFLDGFNPNYLREVVEYWKSKYNWQKEEEELNKFPQFKTRIEGLDIHFMHVKPTIEEGKKLEVIPLLLIHGWPGSFTEFYKIVPMLTTPRADSNYVFEVVCPSIPGFGFSESPTKKGFNSRAAARVFLTLMERLGHRKFYVQGGDWGSYIASLMARYYQPRILGLHVNCYFFFPRSWDSIKMMLISIFPFLVSAAEYKTIFPLRKKLKVLYEETGYFHMHSTKPNTLGCAMSDSPAGMAAYLLEKFPVCANPEYLKLPDGGLTKNFTMDELLTNVMMYWVNNNFTAGARFYKANFKDIRSRIHERVPVTVPSGVALFPFEPLMYPKTLMSQQMKNIVSYTIMPKGGHFAALEE
ncbi:Epoxide hydrolase 1, partial [Stegodyphus mimosarum]